MVFPWLRIVLSSSWRLEDDALADAWPRESLQDVLQINLVVGVLVKKMA